VERPLRPQSSAFPDAPRSGAPGSPDQRNLKHAYGRSIRVSGAGLEVERGDRIRFSIGDPMGRQIAPWLRLIMGLEQPDEGTSQLGSTTVVAGYSKQETKAEALGSGPKR